MRIATELINDGFVPELETVALRRRMHAKQYLGLLVNESGFAVHIGHEQETAFDG